MCKSILCTVFPYSFVHAYVCMCIKSPLPPPPTPLSACAESRPNCSKVHISSGHFGTEGHPSECPQTPEGGGTALSHFRRCLHVVRRCLIVVCKMRVQTYVIQLCKLVCPVSNTCSKSSLCCPPWPLAGQPKTRQISLSAQSQLSVLVPQTTAEGTPH